MKKLLLIFTLALLTQTSLSQSTNSWLDAGSDWHYSISYFNFNYPTGFNHYYYTQDTTINGRTFQQVKSEQQLRTLVSGNYVLGDTVIFPSKHFFTSNDTVYVLNTNNSLQFAWFNNPNVGDIWDFGIQYDLVTTSFKHAYSQVDSINFVTINGQILKEIYSHSCKDTSGTPVQWGDSSLFVNHINRISTKFGPIYGFNGIDTYVSSLITDGFTSDNFLCFESSAFLFYQVGITDCNHGILTESQEMNSKGEVYIFPNPANERIYLTNLTSGKSINIYNSLGQLQLSYSNIVNNEIDISNLTKGFYTYSLTDNQNTIKKVGKFIKK
jgi:hypothetical protein